VVFVPRLNAEEIVRVAKSSCERLQYTKGDAYFMIPRGGVGRYSKMGASLFDKESDDAFFNFLIDNLPKTIEIIDCEEYAEDPAFVRRGVDLLIGMIEGNKL
jgi:uncharacterized protein (UPF0261 family)